MSVRRGGIGCTFQGQFPVIGDQLTPAKLAFERNRGASR